MHPLSGISLSISFFVVFASFLRPTTCLTTDGLALLALKSAVESDPTRALSNWAETDTDPCHWHGVVCSSTTRRVISLTLQGRSLRGYIPSEIGLLDSLTRLALSRNAFLGPVPAQISALRALAHLDLSSNYLNGSLPASLPRLVALTGTLNLSYNAFSGEIPQSFGDFPVTVSLDLRHNNLTGKVPMAGSLVNQGPTAFSGNPGLCGFPLDTQCPEAVNVPRITTPVTPLRPNDGSDPAREAEKKKDGDRLVTVPVVSGISLVIGAVSVCVWLVRKYNRKDTARGKTVKEQGALEAERSPEVDEGQDGKFVVLDEGFSVELEDLLRASAYVVGKSRSGIVYKVVVVGGSAAAAPTVVAVRRLSEGDATWRLREFEGEVEGIWGVQHPNIVRLKAYYYAHDEKLLVSDFVRNGSLWTALHGGPSSTIPLLSWAARLKVAQGAARGLMYIHDHSPLKYVHGNLKSTKILLGNELQPLISGFGVSRLISNGSKTTVTASKKHYPTQAFTTTSKGSAILAPINVYLAPEARASCTKFTQKSDVYSFGVVLMELLTGCVPDAALENDGKGLENLVRKVFREERPLSEIIDPALLSEVHAKKQVTAMFHIALNCTELDPELRPRMRMVSDSLDRIKLQ